MKTSELQGAALDWAVAKCEGEMTEFGSDGITLGFKLNGDWKVLAKGWAPSMCWCPSTDWAQGGPIIEREKIETIVWKDGWSAAYWTPGGSGHTQDGPTPLIAAMRCFVASKLGDEVEVPDELR